MSTTLFARPSPAINVRCIHLDLKGMPPTPERLTQLPAIFAALRVNALLVEWEDTYPFVKYPELRSPTAYSEDTIKEFIANAEKHGIEIIPLVQCLGHLENPLLKERFRHLREAPDSPGELCPLKKGARELVLAMVDDVLTTHRGHIRRFHLGGDESWTLGSCPECKDHVEKHGKASLYRGHVLPLLDHLLAQGIRPMLWDDHMREWPDDELRALGSKADLVVWWYDVKLEGHLHGRDFRCAELVDRYRRAGCSWWGGGAFKVSSDGELPPIEKRARNMLLWVEECLAKKAEGVIATGWSRGSVSCTQASGLETTWDGAALAAAIMWDGVMPEDPVASARAHIASGQLASLIGEPFARCLAAAKELKDWKTKIDASASWQSMERACSISFEPERKNPYTDLRHFGIGRFRDEVLVGVELGRGLVAACREFIPEFWLRRYVAARLFHILNRFNLVVGTVYPELGVSGRVFDEFRSSHFLK